jgi:hypothetical protein
MKLKPTTLRYRIGHCRILSFSGVFCINGIAVLSFSSIGKKSSRGIAMASLIAQIRHVF